MTIGSMGIPSEGGALILQHRPVAIPARAARFRPHALPVGPEGLHRLAAPAVVAGVEDVSFATRRGLGEAELLRAQLAAVREEGFRGGLAHVQSSSSARISRPLASGTL